MITACRARALQARSSTCLSPFYHMTAVRSTWAGRFEPYLDMAQWPKYDGPVYLPDSALMVKTKGRHQTKRFKMDMDRARGGITLKRPRPQPDDYFVEDTVKNRCSACGEEGHKNTKKFSCEARKKQKAADEAISESAAANPSSSGRGRGPKRPQGTRHYRGAHRRPKVVGRLAEVLGISTQVIIFVEHIYYISAYKFVNLACMISFQFIPCLCRMTAHYRLLEEEYEKDHRGRMIAEGTVCFDFSFQFLFVQHTRSTNLLVTNAGTPCPSDTWPFLDVQPSATSSSHLYVDDEAGDSIDDQMILSQCFDAPEPSQPTQPTQPRRTTRQCGPLNKTTPGSNALRKKAPAPKRKR
jgi:hypothetical protein